MSGPRRLRRISGRRMFGVSYYYYCYYFLFPVTLYVYVQFIDWRCLLSHPEALYSSFISGSTFIPKKNELNASPPARISPAKSLSTAAVYTTTFSAVRGTCLSEFRGFEHLESSTPAWPSNRAPRTGFDLRRWR